MDTKLFIGSIIMYVLAVVFLVGGVVINSAVAVGAGAVASATALLWQVVRTYHTK